MSIVYEREDKKFCEEFMMPDVFQMLIKYTEVSDNVN